MTVNGRHGWPNGWHRGELHELDCIGPLCRCERVLRVVETVARAGEAGYTECTEGDSVILEWQRLGARDHPPAPGRSASSRVIR